MRFVFSGWPERSPGVFRPSIQIFDCLARSGPGITTLAGEIRRLARRDYTSPVRVAPPFMLALPAQAHAFGRLGPLRRLDYFPEFKNAGHRSGRKRAVAGEAK